MEEASRLADRRFAIFPQKRGERVLRRGKLRPRKYWEKHWIQLYRQLVEWLRPAHQVQAEARLKALDVESATGQE